jgi:hypothetical protein
VLLLPRQMLRFDQVNLIIRLFNVSAVVNPSMDSTMKGDTPTVG